MGSLRSKVVEVVDNRIARLRTRSVELNQETRISIYIFNDDIRCLVFDMDVMRFTSIKNLYNTSGMTALMGGTNQCIMDMQRIPELYSDHAFLVTVVTDGAENATQHLRTSARITAMELQKKLQALPENWTIACLVPNAECKAEAKKFGFNEGNLAIWSVDAVGLETAGRKVDDSLDTFMVNRAKGVRGTKNLFQADLTTVSIKDVQNVLTELNSSQYKTHVVSLNATKIRPLIRKNKDDEECVWISEYVEAMDGFYTRGCAFYRIDKKETVQAAKRIAIRHKTTKKVYAGPDARQMLGLPQHEIKLAPGDHGEWDLFVESTSTNRNLFEKSEVLVLLNNAGAATR